MQLINDLTLTEHASGHTDSDFVHTQAVVVLDHIPQEGQMEALRNHPAAEEGNCCLAVVRIGKEGKAVSSQRKEAYLRAGVVGHYWKVGMKGIGRVVVDHCRRALIGHSLVEGRRNPAVDLVVDLVVVVTLMVVVDDRRVLIAFVVLDQDVALVHCFLESRSRFHHLLSEMVRIRYFESHLDLVMAVTFANQLQIQRQMIRILVTSSNHSER
jgi:hypothetical protein